MKCNFFIDFVFLF
jgi:hypothetical protein